MRQWLISALTLVFICNSAYAENEDLAIEENEASSVISKAEEPAAVETPNAPLKKIVPAVAPSPMTQAVAPVVPSPTSTPANREIKPYRTFITLQRYNIENNGTPQNPISNIRLEIEFPNGNRDELPGSGQWWPIGNGQVQEINRTYELAWSHVKSDGFNLNIQIYKKGERLKPCKFKVESLSQFNRSYICKVDLAWQTKKGIPPDQQDKEGVQIRVFTNIDMPQKEIPADAIALK